MLAHHRALSEKGSPAAVLRLELSYPGLVFINRTTYSNINVNQVLDHRPMAINAGSFLASTDAVEEISYYLFRVYYGLVAT
jgi:hypothetical protein